MILVVGLGCQRGCEVHSLLALLDSRAKGGKSALEVSNEVQAREAKAAEVVAQPQDTAAE